MASFEYRGGVRLVVFDWAGTTVDHGCMAPIVPFVETLRAAGIELSLADARGPMGMDKKDHLRALLELPRAVEQWRSRHDRPLGEDDVERLFREEFVPRQLASVGDCCELIAGLSETVDWLRQRQIRIGTTTGYFREAAELAWAAGRRQGFEPDANFCASDVPAARPAPWMVYRNMEALGVYPPAAVVKVGDTVPDVGEGRSAGAWTVAVTTTGSEVGLPLADWQRLLPDERQRRTAAAAAKLSAAGAHWVLDSVADLPRLIPEIEQRNAAGERP